MLSDTRISGVSCVTYNPLQVSKFAPSKIYALLSVHYYALQGIFATRLGAEQARGKLDFPTFIAEWEVEQ